MAVPTLVPGVIDFYNEARWSWPRRDTIKHFGLHTPIWPEVSDGAEGLGRYFARVKRKASTHYGTDDDSTGRYLEDDRAPAAMQGVNHTGIHLEIIGNADQTKVEWMDVFSRLAMGRGANVYGLYAIEYGIPNVMLSAREIRAGKGGHLKHSLAVEVFGGDVRLDPGKYFPDEYWLDLCARAIGAADAMQSTQLEDWNKLFNALPTGKPAQVEYSSLVEMVQRFLRRRGYYNKTHGLKTQSLVNAVMEYKTDRYQLVNPSARIGNTMWNDMLAEMWAFEKAAADDHTEALASIRVAQAALLAAEAEL